MIINTMDGKRTIEINYIDAQLKMACAAETNGWPAHADLHFRLALDADTAAS